MNLLTIEEVSKSYSERILIDKVSLGISDGDKMGLIGVNGTGKSTFLKIIAGYEVPDGGRIIKGNRVNIEYLSQNPEFDSEATVLEQIFKSDTDVMKVIREYEVVLEKLQENPESESTLNALMNLNDKMDACNGWQVQDDAKIILTKLGITDFKQRIGELSGGQRKRVALCSALITPSDLLILDEPTNHMDNKIIDWLEKFLNKRKGALLMITHDRYFLDRITNKILELDKGNLYSYDGNYSVYLEKKVERMALVDTLERKRQSLFKKELAWIRRGAKARSTKQKARIDRFDELKDGKVDTSSDNLELSSASTRLGKKIMNVEHIYKAFGEKKLIEDFSHIFTRRDKVGIIGPNGMGKSTLMNILSGVLKQDAGLVEWGETVKIGFFHQENGEMNEKLRAIEYIREGAEYISTGSGEKITASQMLERFLFDKNTKHSFISSLSGGEKRRLYLLRILMEAPNVLFLDEPTNDFDIQTLAVLEDYLDGFNGVVITVSHDRYFLDRVSDKIFSFEGNAKIVQFVGNYTDYQEYIQKNPEVLEGNNEVNKEEKKELDNKEVALDDNQDIKNDKPLKFTFKEKKEFDEIDGAIEQKESELVDVNKKINDGSSDFEYLEELVQQQKTIKVETEYLMKRWTYLNELVEKIESQKNS
ncbi:ABC-F family ATP-binding cassette domain-containing protein [Clostridium estertheticum]|uniref:ABC-F family ATP-binding cassette domain-containing protein n=1 Tax=Clostridium estertheticum TaxID=238834 RepID=UPI001C6EB85A|nr:ABC-F family ATP-binding cassette domain-containing protein [Clostridium estertheticum]MBW9151123.1 ABC-F family ATP-binding cassette domain-containing protein [Clostridium estertheticum]WLC84881.1 ABC-F family ATP-binding cassette domain-containing protein [Clostridium estertheticum]